MGTFLFGDIVFGPVKSRRLGVSLGINLLPEDSKLCNYNCVYCECGWSLNENKSKVPGSNDVADSLESYLRDQERSKKLDVITFAGNGEPSLHPEFSKIIDDTVLLRDKYAPNVKIAVLTNATRLSRKEVVESLKKIELPILKIDTVIQEDFEKANNPNTEIKILDIVENIKANFTKPIIQTMFFKGEIDGFKFDNTRQDSLKLYFDALKEIDPDTVMIYSIARDTPMCGLSSVGMEELNKIGEAVENLGFKTIVTA